MSFNTTGGEILRLQDSSGSIGNYLQLQNTGGGDAALTSTGTSTNVSLFLGTKGSGSSIRFTTNATASNEQFRVANTASAVNYLQVTGNATGGGPIISSQGSDASINLTFQAKGANGLIFQTRGGGTARTALQLIDGGAASVNALQIQSNLTGTAPILSSFGADADIDIAFTPKGAGTVRFGTYTAGVLTPTGYITIKDSGGTTRRLLVG
jgi:hypothetical protein